MGSSTKPASTAVVPPVEASKQQDRARLDKKFQSQPYAGRLAGDAVARFLSAAVDFADFDQELTARMKVCDWFGNLISEKTDPAGIKEVEKLEDLNPFHKRYFNELRFLFALALLKDQGKIVEFYQCSNDTKDAYKDFSAAKEIDPHVRKKLDDWGIDVLIQLKSPSGFVYLPWQIKGNYPGKEKVSLVFNERDFEELESKFKEELGVLDREISIEINRKIAETSDVVNVDLRDMMLGIKEWGPQMPLLKLDKPITEYTSIDILYELVKSEVFKFCNSFKQRLNGRQFLRERFEDLAQWFPVARTKHIVKDARTRLKQTALAIAENVDDMGQKIAGRIRLKTWFRYLFRNQGLNASERKILGKAVSEDKEYRAFSPANLSLNRVRLALAYMVDRGLIEDFVSIKDISPKRKAVFTEPWQLRLRDDNLDLERMNIDFLIKLKTNSKAKYLPLICRSPKYTANRPRLSKISAAEAMKLMERDESIAASISGEREVRNLAYRFNLPIKRIHSEQAHARIVDDLKDLISNSEIVPLTKEEAFGNSIARFCQMKEKQQLQLCI